MQSPECDQHEPCVANASAAVNTCFQCEPKAVILQLRLDIDLGAVEQAATGAEAMRLAEVRAPSLAILDLGLPVADGEASSPHYANAGNLIIVISAHEREAEKVGRLICAHF